MRAPYRSRALSETVGAITGVATKRQPRKLVNGRSLIPYIGNVLPDYPGGLISTRGTPVGPSRFQESFAVVRSLKDAVRAVFTDYGKPVYVVAFRAPGDGFLADEPPRTRSCGRGEGRPHTTRAGGLMSAGRTSVRAGLRPGLPLMTDSRSVRCGEGATVTIGTQYISASKRGVYGYTNGARSR